MTADKPVIVIGAGLSGLGAALTLARKGRPVRLLEASPDVGGCCSTTTLQGYTFNNGAVYVAVPSLLRACFQRLALDFDASVPLAAIAKPLATYLDNGTAVHLSGVETSFVEGDNGQVLTQRLREGLGTLQQRWNPIYRALIDHILPNEPSLPRMLGKLWRYLPRMGGHVDTLIASHFPDEDLQAAVASTLLYTGLPPERLPATQIIGLLALLEEGFHLPRGGMGAISDALRQELQRLSVPMDFGAEVRELLVTRGAIRGVLLADGERIEADEVIATCSGFEVVRRLLPRDAVPRALAAKARKSPLSHRAISIQLGCSAATLPDAFIVNYVPSMRRQAAMHVSQPQIPRWLAYTHPGQVLPELAPAGGAVIELFAPVSGIGSASEWTQAMTDEAVANHLAALHARVPGLSVEVARVMGPQEFARERHLYEGALYGIAPGAAPNAFFPHRSGLSGLYLAGQTTYPGYGVAAAIQSGILAAEALHSGRRFSG